MSIHPLAGQKAPAHLLVKLPRLMSDYYTAEIKAPVAFGTSGHRGSASLGSFNEAHVAAITQAVAEYRRRQGYGGPLFMGFDTHALSEAAFRTALEVLAAFEVETHIQAGGGYTPTPVISFLILEHNRQAAPGALADGLIITPSHNPPADGGLKYNPPHGGPADVEVTSWIEKRAAELLAAPGQIKRLPYSRASRASCVKAEDFIPPFVEALGQVVDLEAVRAEGLRLAADPLGGSGLPFWEPIAERWGLKLTVVNPLLDASFSFMTLDSDGAIRMDCSSPYAMASLIKAGSDYDLAFGNDPDFDRHGIVSGGGLMNPNHYLAVAIDYLLSARPQWPAAAAVGKTMVSSSLIDRVIAGRSRTLYETPVGFKWFVEGLSRGGLLFGGEESAGASFLRFDGRPWTTDKDGFCMALLAAELMARRGRAPHELYEALAERYGRGHYGRLDSAIDESERQALKAVDPAKLEGAGCAGRRVERVLTKAPGNGAPLGGVKVILDDGSWFALRPSGTEPKLKLYAESFDGPELWQALVSEGPALVFGG